MSDEHNERIAENERMRQAFDALANEGGPPRDFIAAKSFYWRLLEALEAKP